jgi:hypothetical protein
MLTRRKSQSPGDRNVRERRACVLCAPRLRGAFDGGETHLKKLSSRIIPLAAAVLAGAAAMLATLYLTGGSLLGALPGFDITGVFSDGGQAFSRYLIGTAYDVLDSIRDGDYAALSRSVHPTYGVVFSPRATISLSSNKCFTAAQVAAFGSDGNNYVWGVSVGGGEPIELTPSEYFSRFVYSRDFARCGIIGINSIVKSGDALENITEVFPDVKFVDFYSPGDDQNADGRDWQCLRLGFEEYQGQLRLTLILHSEWTG